jgi:hypothetical protein
VAKKLYTPILKYKQGERLAVQDLSDTVKQRLLPLFCIMELKNPGDLVNSLLRTWGKDLPFFIDFHPAATGTRDKYINDFFVLAKEQELSAIPVIQAHYDKTYIKAIKKAGALIKSGYALRITDPDVDDLIEVLDMVHEVVGVRDKDLDVIIDLGHLPRSSTITKAYSTIANNLLSVLNPSKFRNVIAAGGSFPEALTGIPKNQISELQRNEWMIWEEVHKKHRSVLFGDYGIDDPNIAQGDRFTIVPTIRYTSGDSWFIVRGEYDPKQPYDFTQFHRLSKVLVRSKLYCGPAFSWGDNRIKECADRTCTGSDHCNHGNLSSWVRISTNHHLTYVVNQLSSLF